MAGRLWHDDGRPRIDGGYGIPLCEFLETRGVEVWRVDPQQVPNITGRPQRDGHACQWWPRRPTVGPLAGAFRPADQGCVRRSYVQTRGLLRTAASQPIQPMQKALTQMHLTRPQVVSDITGPTGMAIIRAIWAGERDPGPWATLRPYRGQPDAAASATARPGQWREAPLGA